MGEMKIDLWLFITENPSIIGDWLVFCIGIILSVLHFKRNPRKSLLILFTFITFLLLSIGNILVFFGAFYSLLGQGYNPETFHWIADVFGILAWVSLLFALFPQETKHMSGKGL